MEYSAEEKITCGFCHKESVQSRYTFAAPVTSNIDESKSSEDLSNLTQPISHFTVSYECRTCGMHRQRLIRLEKTDERDGAVEDDQLEAVEDRVHQFQMIHSSWPAGKMDERVEHLDETVTVKDFTDWKVMPQKPLLTATEGMELGEVFGVHAVYKMQAGKLATEEEVKENEVSGGAEASIGTEAFDEAGDLRDAAVSTEIAVIQISDMSSVEAELKSIEDSLEIDWSDLEESAEIEGTKTGTLNSKGKRSRDSDEGSKMSKKSKKNTKDPVLAEEMVDPTWEPSTAKKSKSKSPKATRTKAEPQARPQRKRGAKKA